MLIFVEIVLLAIIPKKPKFAGAPFSNIGYFLWLDAASFKPPRCDLVSSFGCHSNVVAAVPAVCRVIGFSAPGGNVCVSILAD